MKVKIWLFIGVLFFSGIAFGQEPSVYKGPFPCYIMYDAGSSGTRLYIYKEQGEEWVEHEGPKVAALADPIREIDDESEQKQAIDDVTNKIVSALDDIKQNGPDEKGKPKWEAFDWTTECSTIVSARVYATAGMRLAEQENYSKSAELWRKLKQKLVKKIGNSINVSTRTLSGYEEGLYAWLSVRAGLTDKDKKSHNNFGIVEMGGASSQITFPCSQCDATNNATKTIMIKGSPLQIYSYSFLGLGQDEALKTLGFPSSCAYGIGVEQQGWQQNDCADQISIMKDQGIRDPYNYDGNKRGTYNRVPTYQPDVAKWFLTGVPFENMMDNDIDACCTKKNKCNEYKPKTSCFRAVYLKKYLQEVLDISPNPKKAADVHWTHGAVLCEVDNCLRNTNAPIRRWLPDSSATMEDEILKQNEILKPLQEIRKLLSIFVIVFGVCFAMLAILTYVYRSLKKSRKKDEYLN